MSWQNYLSSFPSELCHIKPLKQTHGEKPSVFLYQSKQTLVPVRGVLLCFHWQAQQASLYKSETTLQDIHALLCVMVNNEFKLPQETKLYIFSARTVQWNHFWWI